MRSRRNTSEDAHALCYVWLTIALFIVSMVCFATASQSSYMAVAGVLSLHGLDVLTATAHSDEQGMAASQYRIVMPEAGLNWRSLKTDLSRALAHQLAIEARLIERAKTSESNRDYAVAMATYKFLEKAFKGVKWGSASDRLDCWASRMVVLSSALALV